MSEISDAIALITERIPGSWLGDKDGAVIEEPWRAPVNGIMLGMYREVKGAEIAVYELTTIETGPDLLKLTMRHFDGALNPKPYCLEPMVFAFTGLDDGGVTLTHSSASGTIGLTYSWPDAYTLAAALRVERPSGSHDEQYLFKRV